MNQLILVLDFSTPEASALITQLVSVYVSRGIPIQFGLVPLMGEAAHPSTLVGKVLWYLVDTGGRAIAMSFLEEVSYKAYSQQSLTRLSSFSQYRMEILIQNRSRKRTIEL